MNMKKINLEDINGYEIIDFLNIITLDETQDDIHNLAIVGGSYVFDNQTFNDDRYTLMFSADYDNWGNEQLEMGNRIIIKENGSIQVLLNECFEGFGTDEELEDILLNWLETHDFINKTILEAKFKNIIDKVYTNINNISIKDIDEMQIIIDDLIIAKSYMKI